MYNLIYQTNQGIHIETVLVNVPKAVAYWKAKILKQTTHTNGKFKVVKN